MNDNEYIANVICEQLAAGSPVVLVSIVDSHGSSPRRSGAQMVVCANGAAYGTIGGGLLEAAAIDESRLALSQGCPRFMGFEFNNSNTNSQGMLCGGSTKLLLDLLLPDKHTREFFRQYHDLARQGVDFHSVTVLKNGDSDRVSISGRSLFLRDGTIAAGNYLWQEEHMTAIKDELRNVSGADTLTIGGVAAVAHSVSRTQTIYCFGAGHVAMSTAHLAALVGFRVVVIDDRDDYANAGRFPDAEEIIITEDFGHALDNLPIDADSYLIIVTRGHQHDRVVLEQALETDAYYIGMIGSRRKRELIYAALREKGVTDKQLARVHCPIGLPINAETPEEIAVSIVSELVQERHR